MIPAPENLVSGRETLETLVISAVSLIAGAGFAFLAFLGRAPAPWPKSSSKPPLRPVPVVPPLKPPPPPQPPAPAPGN